MKIRILRDTVCGGSPVFSGDVVEATDSDSRFLIFLGKAKAFVDEQPKKMGRKKVETDDAGE